MTRSPSLLVEVVGSFRSWRPLVLTAHRGIKDQVPILENGLAVYVGIPVWLFWISFDGDGLYRNSRAQVHGHAQGGEAVAVASGSLHRQQSRRSDEHFELVF